MYSITVNDNITFKSNLNAEQNEFEGSLNNVLIKGNFRKINSYQYHFIMNNKSYNVDVIKLNSEEKTLVIKVNSVKFNLKIKDRYDELLHSLGLDSLSNKKINDIKAPMPGMVLNILVNEGDTIKKGDPLIVLEAMKMENILKSPTDGVIKKIPINKGVAVEKNQQLIQF